MRYALSFIVLPLLGLGACTFYPPTANPDYTIHVVKSDTSSVAVPPNCPSYSTETVDPFDQQPLPQFGCSQARNLAMMAKPDDLISAEDNSENRGVSSVGAIRRLDANQTRGLIMTGADSSATAVTTSSSSNSAISGDVTGASSSAGSAPGH